MKRYDPAINTVYRLLKKEFAKNCVPVVELIEAQTRDPFKVLVATMLSARTKDQTTAAAAKRLFERLREVDDIDSLSVKEIEKLIFPVGFYREKARHLKQWPAVLRERFNATIPSTV
jgi:endonuclease III